MYKELFSIGIKIKVAITKLELKKKIEKHVFFLYRPNNLDYPCLAAPTTFLKTPTLQV